MGEEEMSPAGTGPVGSEHYQNLRQQNMASCRSPVCHWAAVSLSSPGIWRWRPHWWRRWRAWGPPTPRPRRTGTCPPPWYPSCQRMCHQVQPHQTDHGCWGCCWKWDAVSFLVWWIMNQLWMARGNQDQSNIIGKMEKRPKLFRKHPLLLLFYSVSIGEAIRHQLGRKATPPFHYINVNQNPVSHLYCR